MNTLEGKVDFYHKLIEAMKFSDADKMRLGDPDFDNTTSVGNIYNVLIRSFDFSFNFSP